MEDEYALKLNFLHDEKKGNNTNSLKFYNEWVKKSNTNIKNSLCMFITWKYMSQNNDH